MKNKDNRLKFLLSASKLAFLAPLGREDFFELEDTRNEARKACWDARKSILKSEKDTQITYDKIKTVDCVQQSMNWSVSNTVYNSLAFKWYRWKLWDHWKLSIVQFLP